MDELHQKFQNTREYFRDKTNIIRDKNYGSVYIYRMKPTKGPTINEYLYFLLCVTDHLTTIDKFDVDQKQELAEIRLNLIHLISKQNIFINEIPIKDSLGKLN